MTNEQAIEILKNILPAKESYREMIGAPAHCQDMLVWNEPEYYAIEKAIQALEKQIPKKPAETFTDGVFKRPYNICPVCENYVSRVYHRGSCGECSQRLDRSVKE